MKRESPAKIFNSALRGSEETAAYKCFYTFNFKDYQTEFSGAFGQLKFLNDESISPQQSITYTYEEDTCVVLLPITGALNYRNDIHTEELVQSEQLKILVIEKGASCTFHNPFDQEWINYLHIGFKTTPSQTGQPSTLQNIEFKNMNELVGFGFPAQTGDQPDGYIGMYEGRSEGNYTLKNTNHGLFVYVIRGAFEVQGRLMEYRDGLSLWNTNEIEFEALSNNAIILLLEIKLK
jgi:hypothetical protein